METIHKLQIQLNKAGPINDRIIPDVTIFISGEHPLTLDSSAIAWEKQFRAYYAGQAKVLAEALKKSLPGGTLDQLLVELMQSRASLYRVPLYKNEAGKEAADESYQPKGENYVT